ncbi:unnamed protein product [Brassicogethes aeneus]|uniref:Uncharacterized protein n=1 Tax=Brassicogethes aeneus TaxID=1431903 RepID=A0A9P0BH77_BRAAE|nr:unnamed protein product [Brassicogethes aeneus]
MGLMKDENNGSLMTEFIGLRSKMYSLKVRKSDEEMQQQVEKLRKAEYSSKDIECFILNFGLVKKAKGIQRSAVKSITFEDYFNTLFHFKTLPVIQNSIVTLRHKVFTIQQEKIALSPFDDKRIVYYRKTDTVPWGYND